jgi:hypothetical protein
MFNFRVFFAILSLSNIVKVQSEEYRSPLSIKIRIHFMLLHKCFDYNAANGNSVCSEIGYSQSYHFFYQSGIIQNDQKQCLDASNNKWIFAECNNSSFQMFKLKDNHLQFGEGQCLDIGNENWNWVCDPYNENQIINFEGV